MSICAHYLLKRKAVAAALLTHHLLQFALMSGTSATQTASR